MISAGKKTEILRSRAQALAVEPPSVVTEELIEVVEFRLAYETYAIETKWVREVYPLKDLTPVPCAPAFLMGIVNVRGQILSVIDFRSFFDLPLKGLTDLNKIIILKNSDMEVGILADAIHGVRVLKTCDIQASLATLNHVRTQYVRGVTNDRIVVIDGALFMSDEKIIVRDEPDNTP